MTKIFISYRRDDSSYIAGIINEKLEKQFGPNSVFLDIDSIPLGLDFRKHISDSVGQCDVLLAIIGDSWINSTNNQGSRRLEDPADFVRLEIESALKRDIPVIPVLVGKARMPFEAELPASLRELAFRNAAEVRAGLDLQEHLARLVRGVNALSQLGQPKNHQEDLKADQSSTNKSIGTTTPQKGPATGALLWLKATTHRAPWLRWVWSLIIMIMFGAMGFLAGEAAYEVTDFNALAANLCAWPTWMTGIALIYMIWKRL